MIRILQIPDHRGIKKLMQDIHVDRYGIGIMLPKAVHYLLRINSVSNITANILKQEMLSLGGDAAVARDALTGRGKYTDCLLMGSLAQLNRLEDKLNRQPFGLNRLARDLSETVKNYQTEKFVIDLDRYKLNLASRTHIMGIVNLTPDSFSGDGLYRVRSSKLEARSQIIKYVEQLVKDGADIIDIGGESTRPGAARVSEKEELLRVIPVIKLLAKRLKIPLSVDTYKPKVAARALDCGAVIVNDISGLRNPKMAKLVAKYKAGVIIMHMRRTPATMQENPRYASLMDEIIDYLGRAIMRAEEAGVGREKIIIDPGIGFGKALEHNLEIMSSLRELKVLGRPVLIGPSRKSFIGKILNLAPQERTFGTVSACVLAAQSGVKILRVHDVKQVKQALQVYDAVHKG